jgi:hypothetical protein
MVSISSVEAIEQNLEISINTEGDLLACRYDYPVEIMGMISFDRKWHIHNLESLSTEELVDLQSMMS